jgi:hypothetical protein
MTIATSADVALGDSRFEGCVEFAVEEDVSGMSEAI